MVGKREQIVVWLMSQPEDKVYECVEKRNKRSLSANAYFHVLCQKVAEKTSQSLTEVKNQIISDYGQTDIDMGTIILRDDIDWRKIQGLHLHPTMATRVLDNGKLYRVYYVMRGSHTYDSKEMSRLIDGMVQEAKAVGVEVLPPAEIERMMKLWKSGDK